MVVRNCLMSGCHLDIEYHESSTQLTQLTAAGLLSLVVCCCVITVQTGVVGSTLTPLPPHSRMFCLPRTAIYHRERSWLFSPCLVIRSLNEIASQFSLYYHKEQLKSVLKLMIFLFRSFYDWPWLLLNNFCKNVDQWYVRRKPHWPIISQYHQ